MDIARKFRLRPHPPMTPVTAFWLFLCAHVLLWTLLPTLLAWNLPLDTIEALTWGREWQAGYYKHPPASAWLAELFRWGSLDWPLFLLSQLAIAAALWAAWELARDVLSPWMALVAVMALEGVNYYNLTGLEFNANVVQYPCWAIASLAFWRSVRRADGGLGWWTLLGVACGFGMLGKYSFLTLPGSMVAALVLVPSLRSWWREPGPWLAMGIAFAMFAPHLLWAQAHDWPTLHYAAGRATVAPAATGASAAWVRIGGVASFIGAQLAAILPLVALLWAASGRRQRDDGAMPAVNPAERRRDGAILLAMGAGPLLIFLAAGVVGVRLHDMWGSPLFLVIGPAIAVTREMKLRHPRRFAVGFSVWTLLLVVLYGVIAVGGPLAKGKLSRIHYPGRELAAEVARGWHRAEGAGARLPVVAGHAWPAGNVAQYLPPQPDGRPSVYIDADPGRAAWLDDAEVRARGAVFVWEAESGGAMDAPAAMPPADWLQRFPALKVQPPLEIAVRRFGRDFKVQLGWAILPPRV
ncbi:MAG: glycosyltransferase family 39 protein [Janthinobacterium lividum]